VQATLQHTPSAQKPDAQSVPTLQVAPFIFLPQLAFTHCWPLAHWLVWVHASKQAFVVMSQVYGAQMTVGPGRQRPAPSQERAPTTASPSQVPWPHGVPAVYLRHAPAPSHVPSKPQVVASAVWQVVASRGLPPGVMNVQTPIEPLAPHVLQPSVQAVLQHRPSTQKPLVQSAPHVHAWPLARFVRASLLQAASAGASLAASVEVVAPPSWGPSEASPFGCLGRLWLPQPTAAATTTAPTTTNLAKRSIKPGCFMLR
jgi:hypothetical protein